jgi:hypothetical protein
MAVLELARTGQQLSAPIKWFRKWQTGLRPVAVHPRFLIAVKPARRHSLLDTVALIDGSWQIPGG